MSKAAEVTINLNSTIKDLLRIAHENGTSTSSALIDLGGGKEVAVVALVNDVAGYIDTIRNYELCRDSYANQVANAVAADIAANGLPDANNPKPFNIVASSTEEEAK